MAKPIRYERTLWEVRTYEVSGDAEDGWQVDDTYTVDSELELTLPIAISPMGAPWDPEKNVYRRAELPMHHIREALDCRGLPIDVAGDSVHVYVTRRKDGYPIGELLCLSHDSLDPLRIKDNPPDDGDWDESWAWIGRMVHRGR